jgi:hypothetical protein
MTPSLNVGDTVVLVEADGALRGRGRVLAVEPYRVLVAFDRNRPPSWVDFDGGAQ